MQELAVMSASDLANMKASVTEGEQYLLKDSCDEKLYSVSKLVDGNNWLT